MFLCHQCLMCLIDVWAIIGKNSNACSKIITLRAGLIRPNEFQSSLSGNCWGRRDGHIWWIQVWARSWHARCRENHEYIWGFLCQWNTKHCQKQSKHTSPVCINRQRTITLEFLRTEWYEIKWWWQSRKMQFKKSCWRIKKTQLSLELSRAYKTSRQQSHSMSKSNTISAQVRRIPVKQGKQNQWKVNHSEGFQRSRNRASKKCSHCGKSPMHVVPVLFMEREKQS